MRSLFSRRTHLVSPPAPTRSSSALESLIRASTTSLFRAVGWGRTRRSARGISGRGGVGWSMRCTDKRVGGGAREGVKDGTRELPTILVRARMGGCFKIATQRCRMRHPEESAQQKKKNENDTKQYRKIGPTIFRSLKRSLKACYLKRDRTA